MFVSTFNLIELLLHKEDIEKDDAFLKIAFFSLTNIKIFQCVHRNK